MSWSLSAATSGVIGDVARVPRLKSTSIEYRYSIVCPLRFGNIGAGEIPFSP